MVLRKRRTSTWVGVGGRVTCIVKMADQLSIDVPPADSTSATAIVKRSLVPPVVPKLLYISDVRPLASVWSTTNAPLLVLQKPDPRGCTVASKLTLLHLPPGMASNKLPMAPIATVTLTSGGTSGGTKSCAAA